MNETATPHAGLMPIGAFSRRSRLSLKALRLYDALGLLEPALVDPESAYRYYAEGQLERARLIGLLRQLEMPLEQIGAVLEREGPRAAVEIAAYWRGVEAGVKVKRKLVRYLGDFLEGRGETMYEIKTRDVPEQKVLTLERRLLVKDLPGFIEEAHRELYDRIERGGATPAGPSLVIYHGEVNEDSDGPVEVCAPFTGSLEPEGRARVRLEPAHKEAYTTITFAQCEFPGILGAYHAVSVWVKEKGLSMCDPAREVYFTGHRTVGPDEPFCDIAFPMA